METNNLELITIPSQTSFQKNRQWPSSILTLVSIALFVFLALPVAAQSPNTATMIVTVVDQNDAVVRDANISVVNTATGAARDAISGAEGSATFAALPLTGEYKVSVAKTGFTADDVTGLTLRAGETATVKVKLVVSGGKNEVTVFGTTQGVRSDAQIGLFALTSSGSRRQANARAAALDCPGGRATRMRSHQPANRRVP